MLAASSSSSAAAPQSVIQTLHSELPGYTVIDCSALGVDAFERAIVRVQTGTSPRVVLAIAPGGNAAVWARLSQANSLPDYRPYLLIIIHNDSMWRTSEISASIFVRLRRWLTTGFNPECSICYATHTSTALCDHCGSDNVCFACQEAIRAREGLYRCPNCRGERRVTVELTPYNGSV